MQVADLLLKIITENESWVFAYDPEVKLSPGNGTPTHHPERKVTCRKISAAGNADYVGVFHQKFFPVEQWVNFAFYISVLNIWWYHLVEKARIIKHFDSTP